MDEYTEHTMRLINTILANGGEGSSMHEWSGDTYIPLLVLKYKPYKKHPRYWKNTRINNGYGVYIWHCVFRPERTK
jgi:hypothetical protein